MASCSPDRSSSSSEEMDPGREAFQLLYGLIRKTPTQCGGSPVLPEKVDPVCDDSVSSSSDAGPRKTLPPSSSSVAGVPWCLNQINPGLSSVSSMSHFSCILCARVFDKVKDLIRHVDRCHQHSRGKTLVSKTRKFLPISSNFYPIDPEFTFYLYLTIFSRLLFLRCRTRKTISTTGLARFADSISPPPSAKCSTKCRSHCYTAARIATPSLMTPKTKGSTTALRYSLVVIIIITYY